MNNEKFDIFVSYAHEDKRFVGEVIQKLSSAGLSVWIDKEIHHGESISSRIQCNPNTMKPASFVEAKPLLYKDLPQKSSICKLLINLATIV